MNEPLTVVELKDVIGYSEVRYVLTDKSPLNVTEPYDMRKHDELASALGIHSDGFGGYCAFSAKDGVLKSTRPPTEPLEGKRFPAASENQFRAALQRGINII